MLEKIDLSKKMKKAEYKDEIKPGTYELNTAMSVEEMLETMCAADEAETEEGN